MARFLPVVFVLVAAAAAVGADGEYCRDTLGALLTCHDFMFEGAPVASPACCAAYNAAFDADPFCLCYIANGVYGRSTGYSVNVTHAMEIPISCGLVTPPIELCGSNARAGASTLRTIGGAVSRGHGSEVSNGFNVSAATNSRPIISATAAAANLRWSA
ncbi:hypothetical protein GUJ93_ZPchr0002g23503 [Zizania palustris]|uniref:Bifunctional inhibitor/plant lipid transfer protein/seed storage helical domain-containing protein n=1 Tax=Zizania palustris TaxID=103762 RepID=A0A8J5RX67_ZIZPA|nr:hypothetical protein GUJ93_ZPchr0002g23503 [Zizania palustris]